MAKEKNGCGCFLWALGITAAVLFVFWFCTSILFPTPVPDVTGESYSSASQALKDAGFTNLKTVYSDGDKTSPISDSVVTSQQPDAGTKQGVSAEVKLTIMSPSEAVGDTLEDAVGKPVASIAQKITDLGYSITYIDTDTSQDFTSIVNDDLANPNSADAITWIVSSTSSPDRSSKSVVIGVISEESYNDKVTASQLKSSLEAKLSVANAWEALRMYGEETYPWGFDLHSILGVITEEPADENTWHLTAYCDVTNAYGATARNRICDAYVTGTSAHVQIVGFTVS